MQWTGARYADAPTVEVSTWIDAAPDRAWTLVSDIEGMPILSTELQSVAWLDGATEPAVGNAFVGRSRHEALGQWEATSTIVECRPHRVFAWAVGEPGNPAALWRFRIEPTGGGTRLTESAQLGPGRSGLSYAIDREPEKEQKIVYVRLKEFERNMTATLAEIKQRIEAGG